MARHPCSHASRGFMLVESLVALVVLTLGLLGMTSLLVQVTGGAGDTKARSEALAQARGKLDDLRAFQLQGAYDTGVASGSDTSIRDGVAYTRRWTVTQPDAQLRNRLVQVAVSWVDRTGNTRRVNLNTQVAWNDPVRAVRAGTDLSSSVVKPTGGALRGPGTYSPGDATTLVDGNSPSTTDGSTRLLDRNGATLLYLPLDTQGQVQHFTIIHGRVHFDAGASNLPASTAVNLRLSSEGQCVFDNRSTGNLSSGGTVRYRYFDYKCYVGPGWYGNVGVEVTDATSNPTICVGDPGFTATNFSATPAAAESATRSYRGFRLATVNGSQVYLSTGMANSATANLIYGDDGSSTTTKRGAPVPSSYPSIYSGIVANSAQDYFRQDFLVSRITGNRTCADRMGQIAGTFTRNAGRNFCIRPDNWSGDANGNQCPTSWPGSLGGTCSIGISGSYNPPSLTSAVTLTSPVETTTSVSCTTADNTACGCTTTTNSANYSCSTIGGSAQSVTITGTTVSKGANGAVATRSCTRTVANVGCNSLSGFNLDNSSTGSTCQQTSP